MLYTHTRTDWILQLLIPRWYIMFYVHFPHRLVNIILGKRDFRRLNGQRTAHSYAAVRQRVGVGAKLHISDNLLKVILNLHIN